MMAALEKRSEEPHTYTTQEEHEHRFKQMARTNKNKELFRCVRLCMPSTKRQIKFRSFFSTLQIAGPWPKDRNKQTSDHRLSGHDHCTDNSKSSATTIGLSSHVCQLKQPMAVM